MWMRRRATVGVVSAALIAGGIIVMTAPADAAKVSTRLRAAIEQLPVAPETPTGYDARKFKRWIDADRDCEDTRSEVLRAESKVPVKGTCAGIRKGRWVSPFDGYLWTQVGGGTVVQWVALTEAWESGASRWSASTRKAYANDLGDSRTLVTVSKDLHKSRGSRDPGEWLPPQSQCKYVANWVAVKLRWSLTVDAAEKNELAWRAHTCKDVMLTVQKVKGVPRPVPVATPKPTPKPTPIAPACPPLDPACEPTPTPTPEVTPTPTPTATPTPTPASVYYANCDAVRRAGKAPLYRGQPGYRSGLDGDGDGVACE